ncbi:MAG: GTPase ObgE [Candidatus Coatesbacteria bacterium]|nr:MAG: GTPase ObgE [Candidatus Coatesbacteria bacterium]
MFIDELIITVKGGDGGDGVVSFRREKFVPRGGPDGGDGGKGGDVYFEARSGISTLFHLKGKNLFEAERGKHGKGKKMTGAGGNDLIIPVPRGTVVRRRRGGKVIAELNEYGDRFLAARGGRGGRGNVRFATPTHRAPRYAERGAKGQVREYYLELRLIADVGLVGLPNAGKSTLLSSLTRARPKIASYPFTTLSPNLGVVWLDSVKNFVIADLPGLVEDASKGVGLGEGFLKHIERAGVICLVVDIAPGDEEVKPVRAVEILLGELERYRSNLSKRAKIIAANKMDLPDSGNGLMQLKGCELAEGIDIVPISALKREGLDNLKNRMYNYILDEGT